MSFSVLPVAVWSLPVPGRADVRSRARPGRRHPNMATALPPAVETQPGPEDAMEWDGGWVGP
jgi:hypothetical protein